MGRRGWRLWGEDGRVYLAALDVLAEDEALADGVVLYEYQPARVGDLPDLSDDIAGAVQDWLREDDTLAWDDGWPVLDEAAFADAVRDALRAALAEHSDMSEAAWQPTGRTMTAGEARALLWSPDGTPKAQEVG